jgi:hypothetical protein
LFAIHHHPDAEEFGLLANQQRIRIVWDLVEASPGPDGSFCRLLFDGRVNERPDDRVTHPVGMCRVASELPAAAVACKPHHYFILFYFIFRQ